MEKMRSTEKKLEMLNRGRAAKGRFWWGKDGEVSPGRAQQGDRAGHQCHQQPSAGTEPGTARGAAEGGDRAPPEPLARAGAAQPPSGAHG